jgi:hypothetical protein
MDIKIGKYKCEKMEVTNAWTVWKCMQGR